LPLPLRSFEAAVSEVRQVDKYQTVAWEKNRYSVPRRHSFATVVVKAYVDRIEVIRDGAMIARHERSYEMQPGHLYAEPDRRPRMPGSRT
jgi:hypothetical protein